MNQAFLFDVDGTLTPSRGKINEDFRLWLCDFLDRYDGHIITGSDQEKTIEQIGRYCYNKFIFQYQCSGNQRFGSALNLQYESDWVLPEDVRKWLEEQLEASAFPTKTGRHIEERPGTVNFSIVGRNADIHDRSGYVEWDKMYDEREIISHNFNRLFNDKGIQAQIGGETGLDITPIGKDKGQIIKDFEDTTIYFFGDACQEGGNDYPLAKQIIEKDLGFVYNVKDYQETWNILKEIDHALSRIR